MRYLSIGCLAFLVFCLGAADLQARLAVTLQTGDGIVAIVEDGRQLVTTDMETFLLISDEVASKAFELQGQRVHILFYVAGEKRYCVDLRSAGEPAFDLPALQGRGGQSEKEELY